MNKDLSSGFSMFYLRLATAAKKFVQIEVSHCFRLRGRKIGENNTTNSLRRFELRVVFKRLLKQVVSCPLLLNPLTTPTTYNANIATEGSTKVLLKDTSNSARNKNRGCRKPPRTQSLLRSRRNRRSERR